MAPAGATTRRADVKSMAHKTRAAAPRPAVSANLTQLRIVHAFRTWLVPALAAPAALVVYVLNSADLMERLPAVATIGLLGLATALWAGLRGFISGTTRGRLALGLLGYAALWLCGIAWPFLVVLDPGPPVFGTQMHAQQTTPLPADLAAGRYRLLVQGTLASAQVRGSRQAHYRAVLKVGEYSETIEGDFTERYLQQRLGRRGRTTVRDVHTDHVHRITLTNGRPAELTLSDVTPADVVTNVTVTVYRDRFPLLPFVALALVLGAGAVVIDRQRPREQSEGLLTTLTASAVFAVTSLAWTGGAHPGVGQLAVNTVIGALAGTVCALLLARLTRPWLARSSGK
jgi:hypothetical protein